ncbi:mammalian cell entry protein [Mycobacteroides franklinii]|uniref:Mammalian cell entry protein n=1 Tax=Mycobacteroides franklinii TaxID=948102 RepID=A0A1S1L2E0_9MYCO|nr:MlaD family protein [Mycobacteroides franklinii]OHU21259.1 mammalian cell entry protein [Mycobacteroides franklinii]
MKRTAALSVLLTGALLSGCATNGLSSLPLPAPRAGSGGYTLTALFTNALNLPDKAKVKLAGADVGRVESMVTRNYVAVITLRIMDGVQLPSGTTAQLRSATPLGDVFVSVAPPPDSRSTGPLLQEGDTIGLESTAAASTVESVMSSAALLINGGAVRNLTNIVNGLGKATGDQGHAFGNLINDSNRLLGKIDARSTQLDAAITNVSQLSARLETKRTALADMMKAAGPATQTVSENTDGIIDLARQVGGMSRQLAKFPSIAGTDQGTRSVVADLNDVAGALNDVVVSPDTKLSDVSRLLPILVKMTSGDSIPLNAQIDKIALGSLPDIGFQGDPGFHGPKRYDWAKLVGSMKYTLWRLQERVVGQGPDSSMGGAGTPPPPNIPAPIPNSPVPASISPTHEQGAPR